MVGRRGPRTSPKVSPIIRGTCGAQSSNLILQKNLPWTPPWPAKVKRGWYNSVIALNTRQSQIIKHSCHSALMLDHIIIELVPDGTWCYYFAYRTLSHAITHHSGWNVGPANTRAPFSGQGITATCKGDNIDMSLSIYFIVFLISLLLILKEKSYFGPKPSQINSYD